MSPQPGVACGVRRGPFFALLLIILLFHLSGYVGNEMATSTMSLTMSVVEQGRFIVDDYVAGARELAYHNGHFYSGMPPGQSFVAIPLYFVLRPAITLVADRLTSRLAGIHAAAKYDLDKAFAVRRLLLLVAFTALIAAPCAAATSVMVLDLARAAGTRVRLTGALLLPLGTLWWTYGTEYGPRVMDGFLLLLPVWWVFVARDTASLRKQWVMAVVCGVGLALAVFIRYELIFPVAFVGLWLLWRLRGRQGVAMVAAGIVVASLGVAYHDYCFGSPTANAYSAKIWDAEALELQTGHSPEGRAQLMYEGQPHVVFNQAEWLSVGPENLAAAFWSGGEALPRFSPFLLLAPWGAWLLWRRGRTGRQLALLLLAVVATALLVVALMPNPGTMGNIGPRYMLWAVPALGLLALPAFSLLPGWLRGVFFAASFAPSYLAAMLTSHTANAWSFGQLAHFGLTNYALSRAQEAGVFHSPLISTAIVLVFWGIVALVFLRPRSRWYLCEPPADHPTEIAP